MAYAERASAWAQEEGNGDIRPGKGGAAVSEGEKSRRSGRKESEKADAGRETGIDRKERARNSVRPEARRKAEFWNGLLSGIMLPGADTKGSAADLRLRPRRAAGREENAVTR